MAERALLTMALAVLLSACTHTMEVKNIDDYTMRAGSPRSVAIAIETVGENEDQVALGDAVREGLAGHSSVTRVAYSNEAPPDFHPDYTVKVAPSTEYRGSWWNYATTFPGFLLFTHAWNGYNYGAAVKTELTVSRVGGSSTSRTIDVDYDLRHCDFERGAWNSSGWYTPGWGGLNLIIGFFMVNYDEDATEDFLPAVRRGYGSYVANAVIDMVREHEGTRPAMETPAAAEMAPADAPEASAPESGAEEQP